MSVRLAATGMTAAVLLIASPAARAQEEPDTEVQSTVVVDGVAIEDGKVPASESGLTVDPVVENDAERIRKDAERNLVRGYLPSNVASPQPSVTSVSVGQVTVVRPNRPESEACVQVGVIGGRSDCRRPPK